MVRLVFLVLYSIYEWILRVIFSRGDSGNPLDFRLAPGLNLQQLLQDLDKPPSGLQLEIFNILKAVSILIVAALIIVAFILAVRRLRARRIDDDVEETRDTILSLDLLKEQLANLFSRKNQHAAAPEPFIPIIGDDARSQIRRTYQSLLAWAAERGVPRPPGLTPSEYSMLISRELSIADTHAETITSAYLEARYSPAPILPARADEVVRAWTQIESVSAK
jgi:hypothetical protein